jgi:hypothetical protein
MSFIDGPASTGSRTAIQLRYLIVAALPGALAAAAETDPEARIDRSILGPARGCSSVG